jgi:ankyrin repeat protein
VLYQSTTESQQWLIYYITRPLIGAFEPITTPLALIKSSHAAEPPKAETSTPIENVAPKKKDIKSFGDLLNHFPMIARQMQPGLDRLFNEFGKELGKPLPPPPSRTSSTDSVKTDSTKVEEANGSIHKRTNGSVHIPFGSAEPLDDEEDHMRRALETTVTGAIDLFQLVDKQQLSFLGATTDLTGPLVERLIERYVSEQVHDNLLFPRLCNLHRAEDSELDRRIRQMENIDVSQVGIVIEGGRKGKEDLLRRLNKGVETFRKMGVAGCPHEMLEILLATEQAVTEAVNSNSPKSSPEGDSEKQAPVVTVNADVLVSLLLIVLIRSQIRHLQARLSYMQRFIYIDDVESGEMGYALSTFEAVLSYLAKDAGGLRRASMRNKRLWDATKKGQIAAMSAILESRDNELVGEPEEYLNESVERDQNRVDRIESAPISSLNSVSHQRLSSLPDAPTSGRHNLAHVFPFEIEENTAPAPVSVKGGKKVSMDMRSLSSSSAFSFKSRTTTIGSMTSGIEGDTSIASLSQTQDPTGNSILMMAVEARQPESLRYMLSLPEYYPAATVLEDTTSEGTTLLSAAIQLAHTELIDIILDFAFESVNHHALVSYLAKADTRGRTAAHYLFNAPQLMSRLDNMLPWRKKDKIGQTPLFALCRSYDHPDYSNMVSEALIHAKKAQGDGLPLRLDDHTDNKGNTLLHIVNDPVISHRILQYCDSDPNAVNDKKLTPLMLASKYGRIDMVRVFFSDPRVDLHLKELRGLTAVELAKDDDVRNKIDDLTLLSNQAGSIRNIGGRITTIVRSYFVEDGSIRLILKSGAPSNTSDPNPTTFTITTSRRTIQDFENLAKWLSQEHPASYIPTISAASFRSPFQIHSRPSRAVLHDIQTTLDRFLKILLMHPTFGTHEALWEFFLVPDMQTDQIAERSELKSRLLAETIAEEYEPVADVRDVEQLISHSREMTRGINVSTRSIIRRGHQYQNAYSDLSEALNMASAAISTFGPPATLLPRGHVDAFAQYSTLMVTSPESSPLLSFVQAMTGFHTTILAIQSSLLKPTNLINRINEVTRAVARSRQNLHSQSLPRKFQFPGLEESRLRSIKESERKIADGEQEIVMLGKELRYMQEVVLSDLAGWTEWREKVGKEAVRMFVKGMVVKEKERYKGLQRCLRKLNEAKENEGDGVDTEG